MISVRLGSGQAVCELTQRYRTVRRFLPIFSQFAPRPKDRQLLESSRRNYRYGCSTQRREQRCTHDRRWPARSCRRQNCNCGCWNKLHRTGVDRQKCAHRISGDAGARVERFQIAHGSQTERRRGVAESEHVGRHVHQHRSHRRMIRWNFGEKSAHQRSQAVRHSLHDPRTLSQSHQA